MMMITFFFPRRYSCQCSSSQNCTS